ncbi:MAG: phosphotransferase [Chloroflexota bacterium]
MEELLSQISPHKVTQAITTMMQRPITLLDWAVDSAFHGFRHKLTGGVYRLVGQADAGTERISWSLILKIVMAPPAPNDVSHPEYWKRELFVYQSSSMNGLSDAVALPHCYLAEEIDESTYWLWLEEVEALAGSKWPLEQYQTAARHLGIFNGNSLIKSLQANKVWLSRKWLQAWLADYADLPSLIEAPATWQHPLTKDVLSSDAPGKLLALWQGRETLFDALHKLPQGLCHMDAYRPNLMAQAERTVLIDWDKAGIGAIGEELGGMVAASMIWFHADAQEAHRLGELAFAGYVDGLREAGWTRNERLARLGFTASSALRWGIPGVFWLRGTIDPPYVEKWFDWWGKPLDFMLEQWALVTDYLLDLADEAFSLVEEVV